MMSMREVTRNIMLRSNGYSGSWSTGTPIGGDRKYRRAAKPGSSVDAKSGRVSDGVRNVRDPVVAAVLVVLSAVVLIEVSDATKLCVYLFTSGDYEMLVLILKGQCPEIHAAT